MSNLSQAIALVDKMTQDELTELVDHIRAVYKLNHQQRALDAYSKIKVEDKVRLVGNRKPQYLTGLTGVIREKKNSRVVIELDCGPVGKFRNGRVITSAAGLKVL